MLNEQDYRAVLEELGFDLQGPPTGTRGPALRHTIRRFIRIPDRPPGSDDAFWPSLYWHRHGEFCYVSTPPRDADHFRIEFWAPAPSDRVLHHEVSCCFVPVQVTRAGLRMALESLFLAQSNW